MDIKDRTWAKISLKNIENNFNNIKKYAKSKVLAVVKADAYGHGMIEVARALEGQGADYFGVATALESVTLRESGIKKPILLLGFFVDDEIQDMLENDITFTIYDVETAKTVSKIAVSLDKIAKIHIKIDSGMSRLGFKYADDCEKQIKEIHTLPNIFIEGVFSHFAVADDDNKLDFTKKQAQNFKNIVENLRNDGISIEIAHISASGGLMYFPEFNFDMVRAGIILYGYYPSNILQKNIEVSPVMTLFSKIAQVKTLKTGESVSYGLNFTAERDMKIAVVTIGYADGYFRINSNRAYFMFKGKKVNILGNICMDMCMIDVSNVENIKKGDEIVIFGCDSGEILGADIVADFAKTIPYEVLCAVSRRVPRVY
ncbi:MAG: alanine racemase [Clostridia bacterium]